MISNNKLTVSIALCTYNGERFLQAQLDSIAKQTHLPDEVVVGDDGSSDSTIDILNRWSKNVPFPVRITKNEKNLGFSKNFETISACCSGDIIFFCDQDDVWFPNKIEKIINEFNTNSSVGTVYHNAFVVDSNGNERGYDIISLVYKTTRLGWLRFMCPVTPQYPIVAGCCIAIKKDLLNLFRPFFIPFDENMYIMSRASTHIVMLREPLMQYRFHENNVSLKKNKENLDKYTSELSRDSYKLDVSRFWGHYSDIQEYRRRIIVMNESPEKRNLLRFLNYTISHLTNRERIQRNLIKFFPLLVFEIVSLRYFYRDQPFRSLFYDITTGLKNIIH